MLRAFDDDDVVMQQPPLSKSTTMPPYCGLHWMPMPLQHGTPTRLQLLRSSQLRLQLGLLLMYATTSWPVSVTMQLL